MDSYKSKFEEMPKKLPLKKPLPKKKPEPKFYEPTKEEIDELVKHAMSIAMDAYDYVVDEGFDIHNEKALKSACFQVAVALMDEQIEEDHVYEFAANNIIDEAKHNDWISDDEEEEED